MADLKITELDELTNPLNSDLWAVAHDPAGTPITQKVKGENIYKALMATVTEKTVSGGVLTVDKNIHKVQPESSTADDIDTISGMVANTWIVLYVSDYGTDTLTFKNGTGNISCQADIAITRGFVLCYYDGTKVHLSSGGGGRTTLTAAKTLYVGYNLGTATMTIASPCVVTKVAHGLENNDPVIFSSTGALPTGLTIGTAYFVVNKATDTFQVSLTAGGAAINTSGTQSGTHSCRTGNNANDGSAQTRAGALLTPQKAIDNIVSLYDTAGFTVTVQLADGTYTSGVSITAAWDGGGRITIQGNSGTPANCLISMTSANCFTNSAALPAIVLIKDMELRTTSSGICIDNTGLGIMTYSNVNFGATATAHVRVTAKGAKIQATGNYTINGNTGRHILCLVGEVQIAARTITLTGTPAFSSAFADVQRTGFVDAEACTFTGSATGKRYNVVENSILYTGSAADTYLPGNAIGTINSGGRYDTAQKYSRVSTQHDNTTVTPTNIAGLSATLLAGRTYKGRLVLYTTSNVGGGVRVDFDGGAATVTTFVAEAYIFQTGAVVAPGTSRSTALATDIANVTAVTVATIYVDFTITVNGAGTFIPRFGANVAVGTSSVLVGSNMVIEEFGS